LDGFHAFRLQTPQKKKMAAPAIPFEILLIIGVAVDLVLAYLGFNLFRTIRKRLKAKK